VVRPWPLVVGSDHVQVGIRDLGDDRSRPEVEDRHALFAEDVRAAGERDDVTGVVLDLRREP